MHRIIDDEDLDLNSEKINARSMGKKMRKMRFKQDPSARPRRWRMGLHELARQFQAYALILPEKIAQKMQNESPLPIHANGGNGGNGGNGAISSVSTVSTVLFNRLVEDNLHTSAREKPCFVCGQINWVKRVDGGYYCATCHPGATEG
jgi:hypothetical protein